MKRKLFAFDIDGTLLNSKKEALDSTREALHSLRQQGHLVTVATGRSRHLAQDIIRDLEFTNYVVCNGAGAFLDHEQIYKNLLDKEEITRLTKVMDEKEIDTAFVGLDESRRYSNYDMNKMERVMASFGSTVPDFAPDYHEEEDVYQCLTYFSKDLEQQVSRKFPEFRFIRWHEDCMDVLPKNGSKAATLSFMAQRLGIDQEDVIAFGDGENDIEMLEMAGVGVAMGNAIPEIQQSANMVTNSNDQDGIWKALKELAVI